MLCCHHSDHLENPTWETHEHDHNLRTRQKSLYFFCLFLMKRDTHSLKETKKIKENQYHKGLNTVKNFPDICLINLQVKLCINLSVLWYICWLWIKNQESFSWYCGVDHCHTVQSTRASMELKGPFQSVPSQWGTANRKQASVGLTSAQLHSHHFLWRKTAAYSALSLKYLLF